ncbi:MAG: hypothetical protein ABIV43_03115 [Candidatus Saccharimonadales bacterium]
MSERTTTNEQARQLSFEEMHRQYEESLAAVVDNHIDQSTGVHRDYTSEIDGLVIDPELTEDKFKLILDKQEGRIDSVVTGTQASVERILTKNPGEFINLLGDVDFEIWERVRYAILHHGSGSATATSIINKASSPQAKSIMRIALDADVWNDVKYAILHYGSGSATAHSIIKKASCSGLGAAMRASLDSHTWREVNQAIRSYGAQSSTAQQILRSGSSPTVIRIMRGFMPEPTQREESSPFDGGDYGNQPTVEERLADYDDVTLESILQNMFKSGKSGFPFTRVRSERRQQNIDEMWEKIRTIRAARAAAEESARQARSRQSAEDERRRQQSTHTANRQKNKSERQTPEIEAIIKNAVVADRQFKWLQNADRQDVKRVVATVRQLRARAAEEGKELSDRAIYLRYRRAVDKPQGEVDPAVLQSYKILEALMGGNIRGKLDF